MVDFSYTFLQEELSSAALFRKIAAKRFFMYSTIHDVMHKRI